MVHLENMYWNMYETCLYVRLEKKFTFFFFFYKMSFEKERIRHLKEYLNTSFSVVVFDQIARQMERHEISSKFTLTRFREVFSTMLKQEREEYMDDLNAKLNYYKKNKKQLMDKINSKQKKYEKYLMEAYTENKNARKNAQTVRSLTKTNQKRIKSIVPLSLDINELNNEIKNLTQPIEIIRKNLNGFLSDLEFLKTEHVNFIELTKEKNKTSKENYVKQYEQFRKKLFSSTKVIDSDNELKAEKEKTAQMKASINKIINHISIISKKQITENKQQNENQKEKENEEETKANSVSQNNQLTADCFSNALFRMKVKNLYTNAGTKAANELGLVFQAPQGNSETIIQGIAKNVDAGLNEVKAKYDEIVVKQQARIDKLQKELRRAHRIIIELQMKPSLHQDIMNQFTIMEQKMTKTQQKTDLKIQKLQELSQSLSNQSSSSNI